MEAIETLAYIAGLFDGEGCVLVSHPKTARSSIVIQITNSNRDAIEYVARLLEGSSVYNQKRYGRKEIWRLQLSGKLAIDALELLLPYLIVKKDVAEMAIDFYDACLVQGRRHKAVSEAEMVLRESYTSKIKSLNGRGGAESGGYNV